MTTFTNKADFIGSLMYNINEMTYFIFSSNTDDQAHKYSDLYPNAGNYTNYITGVNDTTFTQGGGITGANTTYTDQLRPDQYEAGDWFIFGLKFLPWFPPPSDEEGVHIYRYNWNHDIYFNKASTAVLIPTATTAAKIGGMAVITFVLGKLVVKIMNKRR